MMPHSGNAILKLGVSLILISSSLMGMDLDLQVIRFPERRTVEFDMGQSAKIPAARIKAKVQFRSGQNRIEVKFERMKPAVLFAGDVTCYVLWAVNRDGGAENLGELWVRPEKDDDKLNFSTGLRTFALLITAESYSQVSKPSEMIVSRNLASEDRQAPATELIFSDFAPAPKAGLQTLANVKYDGKTPLDVLQAEKVYQIAERYGASEYAPTIYQEARTTLQQSRQMARSSRSRRGAQEFARKSVASSNEAIRITLRRKESEALEAEIEKRRARMDELEKRADEAEAEAKKTEEESRKVVADLQKRKSEAEASVTRSQQELERIEGEKRVVEKEKASLESALTRLRSDRAQLQNSLQTMRGQMGELRQQKSVLEGRLQGALSQVAETRESARGTIVNLPDILFDVNKATLKTEARQVLAKLAGILLIMQDLNLRVEGHTDSTGSSEYNQKLSEERASSVVTFLREEGIDTSRMIGAGYGLDRPIADNSSADGRRKNRRVEIVIAEGRVREAEG